MRDDVLQVKVRSDTSPAALAGVISSKTLAGVSVCLSAVGAQAVATAVKSVAAANRLLAPHGRSLSIIPGVEPAPFVEKSGNVVSWVVTTLRLVDAGAYGQQTSAREGSGHGLPDAGGGQGGGGNRDGP